MPTPVLSSDLSYAAVLKIFQDNADYDLPTLDETKAIAFIKAGRMLLAYSIRRSSQAQRHEEIELEPEIVERMVNRAEQMLAVATSVAAVNQEPVQYIPDPDWRC